MFLTIPANYAVLINAIAGGNCFITGLILLSLALILLLGYRINKKKGSPVLWGILCFGEFLSVAYSAFLIYASFIMSGIAWGLIFFFCINALVIYLILMGCTLAATFSKRKSTTEDPGTT